MIETLKTVSFVGNELWRWGVFCLVVLLSLAIGKLTGIVMARGREDAGTKKREWIRVLRRALSRPMVLVGFAVGFRLGMLVLITQDDLEGLFLSVSQILTTIAIAYGIYCLVDIVDHYLASVAEATESKVDDVLAPLVGKSIRITIFVIVTLNVVHVISGKSITTILAGLGVGGLAVALAGQDTIKNFFGSIVILGDRPFEIGDRIKIGDVDGPVERVGFRSTKIRTLAGHLVTIPNSDMVSKPVENIGKRPYIRRVSTISITYDTPPDKVQRAVDILREILDNHEGMDPEFPPRVYFTEFGDCSLNILMIYWYHPPAYWDYLAFSERVNRQILERFNAEGIEFAFPTQTLYLANDDKRQLSLRMLRDEDR